MLTACMLCRGAPSSPQVEKAEQDKQSAIIRAQGEAASATLIGQAVQQNPAFITLRKIEVGGMCGCGCSGAAYVVLRACVCWRCWFACAGRLPSQDWPWNAYCVPAVARVVLLLNTVSDEA